ncbi:MAG: carboxypeptidase-like regulatory domain-containing protein [Acidobacteriota bacterium]
MKSRGRLLFYSGLALLIGHQVAAQVTMPAPSTPGTGSVSGRVLVQGSPVSGVHLSLQRGPIGSMVAPNAMRSESDAEGRYRFSGLAAGSYQVNPVSSVYVWGEGRPGSPAMTITLSDGEQATDVDVTLRRGGVVMGKITDQDGIPIVERFVQIDSVGAQPGMPPVGIMMGMQFMTDDRGVYRYYGVPPGKYRVSCGEGEGSFQMGMRGKLFPRTFHPDVTDQSLATIIEVGAGTELTGVDIRLSPPLKTYTIGGRVVDSDTGQPVKDIGVLGELLRDDGRGVQARASAGSGATGEFDLAGVRPGRWRVSAEGGYTNPMASAGGYSDPIDVEVRNENVTGVEIRVKRGVSIAGVAVLEGDVVPNAPRLQDQRIAVFVRGDGSNPATSSRMRSAPIGADGGFRIDGLRPGLATFQTVFMPGVVRLSLIRIERDGLALPEGVEIGAGENVTGVRLVFAYATASIHGQVVISGGVLPAGTTLMAIARPVGGARLFGNGQIDTRGNFTIEGLVPGQYEIEARPMPTLQNQQAPPPGTSVKQTVTVAGGETLKVTLTYVIKTP